MAKPVPPSAGPKDDPSKPVLVWFTMKKQNGMFHALAIQTRGLAVLKERVLESDDNRNVVMDRMDTAQRAYIIHGVNPFVEMES